MTDSYVKDIMTKFVQTVSANSSVEEASQIMTKLEIGSVIVTVNGMPAGVVTERDIVAKVTTENLKASDILVEKIMSKPIISIEPDKIIDEAALMMLIYKIRRLVVVENNGEPLGIVTTNDIASWLARKEDYKNNALNAVARSRNVVLSTPYQ